MPEIPTLGQLTLLFASVAMFVAAEVFSLLRLGGLQNPRSQTPSPGTPGEGGRDTLTPTLSRGSGRGGSASLSKTCLYLGIIFGLGVLVWHSFGRGSWLPLSDNFDALIWLALLLGLFVAYTQRVHPLRGLDWFVLPIVAMLLVAAAVFGRAKPHEYLGTVWSSIHLLTAFGGTAAFAVAAAVGAMYLIADRRLRSKRPASLGSLERLEHFTRVSVALGFSLLTVGLITGFVLAFDTHGAINPGPRWYENPKVWLAFAAWLVYALVLHAPMNPVFRGRRAAMLSVVGFVLLIGTLVALQFTPGGGR